MHILPKELNKDIRRYLEFTRIISKFFQSNGEHYLEKEEVIRANMFILEKDSYINKISKFNEITTMLSNSLYEFMTTSHYTIETSSKFYNKIKGFSFVES